MVRLRAEVAALQGALEAAKDKASAASASFDEAANLVAFLKNERAAAHARRRAHDAANLHDRQHRCGGGGGGGAARAAAAAALRGEAHFFASSISSRLRLGVDGQPCATRGPR